MSSIGDTETLIGILALPDHLRKTYLVMQVHPYSTADDVARETKRARAVESAYLNQLALMGLVQKERQGRKAFFHNTKAKAEMANVYRQIKEFPSKLRADLCSDMLTALVNRVEVFSRVNHS